MTHLLKPNDNGLASIDEVKAWMEAQSQDTIEEKVAKNTSDGWEGFGIDYGLIVADSSHRLTAFTAPSESVILPGISADRVHYYSPSDGSPGSLYTSTNKGLNWAGLRMMDTRSMIVRIMKEEETVVAGEKNGKVSAGGQDIYAMMHNPSSDIIKFKGRYYATRASKEENKSSFLELVDDMGNVIERGITSRLAKDENGIYFVADLNFDGRELPLLRWNGKDTTTIDNFVWEGVRSLLVVKEREGMWIYSGHEPRSLSNTRIYGRFKSDSGNTDVFVDGFDTSKPKTEQSTVVSMTAAPLDYIRRLIDDREGLYDDEIGAVAGWMAKEQTFGKNGKGSP